MSDRFLVFEVLVKKRGRKWRWGVCTSEGKLVMQGSETSRPGARYEADRALFLLLLTAPHQWRLSEQATQRARGCASHVGPLAAWRYRRE
jgi:hypothetical protein